jgi:hypothetical protein
MDDVRLWREDGRPMCSIECSIRHHSPDGIEWGYAGSGPADLALNILDWIMMPQDMTVELWDGNRTSVLVERLHERFKREVIAKIPKEGTSIPALFIKGWIEGATEKLDG